MSLCEKSMWDLKTNLAAGCELGLFIAACVFKAPHLGCVHAWFKGTGARVQYSLGTNADTPFFKYPRQNSGTVPVPKYKVDTFVLGH